ncbi:hypothetical protein L6164_016504 [Bauhinia variegata]|uniref:Uncharacterized protein n=1 Tax=Bauhinia variegata TaxID=167791 RepID=A0ACB9NPR7_BAUVA|nr:hypothetical protein L6164_016504 [Bauhinia variegata]
MGKQIKEKDSCTSPGHCNTNSHNRVWGILHIMKHHQWRHVKKRLMHRRHSGGRNAARFETPESIDSTGNGNLLEGDESETTSSNVEEQQVRSTPPTKHSVKSRLKALITEEKSKKKGRHNRSSTCPAKCHLPHTEANHSLNTSVLNPLGEMLLALESSEIFPEISGGSHHATDSLDVLPQTFPEKPTTNNEMSVECDTTSSSDSSEHSQIHKHGKEPAENQTFLQKTSSYSTTLGNPEEKVIHAKILTADASPQVFKDFLDALEMINANNDFLMKVLQHPSPSLAHRHPKQQAFGEKVTLSKSLSFPLRGSSSGSKGSELGQLNKMEDDRHNATTERQSPIESETQSPTESETKTECLSEASEDFQQQSMSSDSSYKFDRIPSLKQDFAEEGSHSLSVSAQNQMVMKRFKDLRKKIKDVVAFSKNERHRITMDGILHKIPHGNNVPQELKKIIDKSKGPAFNGDGEEKAKSGYDNRLPSFSFRKRQFSPMRTSSMKESMHRYSQLYETSFNKDVKCPKSERLRVRPEDTSSAIKTPKSFKRFLSMPNLKSYFHQNDEPAVVLSPIQPIRKVVERTRSISRADEKSLGHSDSNKIPDYTIQGSISKGAQNENFLESGAESGLDVNNEAIAKQSIKIDHVPNLIHSDSAACNEQDAGQTRESAAIIEEAKSVFSEYSSLNDINFEKSSLSEDEVQYQLDQGLSDGLGDVDDQQETKVDYLQKDFDIQTSLIEVDARKIAEFNYVREVLEISGFTGHKPLGIWHSDDHPVDPLVYEELEGRRLSDPNCSSNEVVQRDHLLLFDLINEVLMDIFGRSYSYYPKPLSFVCHLHPMPSGQRVLRGVWTLVSFYLGSTSPNYLSLDYYSSIDLSKPDGWMNLQFESECVALQLDDLILDDLLEEIFST